MRSSYANSWFVERGSSRLREDRPSDERVNEDGVEPTMDIGGVVRQNNFGVSEARKLFRCRGTSKEVARAPSLRFRGQHV